MRPARSRRLPAPALAAAAALLVAIGLAVGSAVWLRQERRNRAAVEERLAEQHALLATARSSLADTERELRDARRRIEELRRDTTGSHRSPREAELEARVAELTHDLEGLRGGTPEVPGAGTSGRRVDLAVTR